MLFLDEPTTGLDPQSRNDLWEVIESLVGGGTTVLLTTQYLEEADRLADTLVVVDHGQVIAEGTPARAEGQPGGDGARGRPGHRSRTPARTAESFDALGSHTPTVDGTVVEVTVDDGPEVGHGRPPLPRPGSGSSRRPSPCASPASTTSSWPSPAAGPRTRPRPRTDETSRRGAEPGGAPTASRAHRDRGTIVMTTTIAAPTVSAHPTRPDSALRLRWAVADTLTITQRNLLAYTRIPEALFFSTVQPIMFVLLFRYVFGGAIQSPGAAT